MSKAKIVKSYAFHWISNSICIRKNINIVFHYNFLHSITLGENIAGKVYRKCGYGRDKNSCYCD